MSISVVALIHCSWLNVRTHPHTCWYTLTLTLTHTHTHTHTHKHTHTTCYTCLDCSPTHPHTLTSSQIGLRGGEWRRLLLEEHFHEAAGTSYSDAHASGFEVLPDDIVIKNFLQEGGEERFEVRSFPVSGRVGWCGHFGGGFVVNCS